MLKNKTLLKNKMIKNSTFNVYFRRKREGKTDYKKRLKLLLAGKPRLVVRRSLKYIWLQIVEYDAKGDVIIASVHSRELKKLGWKGSLNNIPASYLCGYMLGKMALSKKIQECILDIGRLESVKGTAIYATLKGAIDAGLKVAADNEVFPKEERIKGIHISNFAKKLKENKEKYEKQFSGCIKTSLNPETVPTQFEKVKEMIK